MSNNDRINRNSFYMSVKSFFICLLVFGNLSFGQEKELENFTNEINFYIDFTLGKTPTYPVNESNQNKFRKKVDDVFIAFILQKNSNQCDKFITSRDDKNLKFIRASGKCEIYLSTFITNNKSYSVFSYTSMNKINYFVKDDANNTIVYDGDSKASFVDNIMAIDDSHIILIEITGDHHYSRKALVLSTKKDRWTKLEAFEGKAFGQVPADYFNSKYVKKRAAFNFSCDSFPPMYCPKDFNKIYFDNTTKTLSYKIYSQGKQPQIVSSKWENEMFKIDDYFLRENQSYEDIPMPR